jgi:tetratricopeptide (TPR) repeat protein
MRSFFPPLAAVLLLCASTSSAQIGVFSSHYARGCFLEALSDGANTDPCDRSLGGEMLVGRDLAATYVNRAVVRTNAGRLAAALQDLKRAESLRPDLGEIYASRGNVFFYQNNFEEAIAEHNRGIEAGMKKLHAAHYNRGLALENLGRFEEAKEAYRQSIALAPEFELAKTRLRLL